MTYKPPATSVFGPVAIVGNFLVLLGFFRNRQLAREEGLHVLLSLSDMIYGAALIFRDIDYRFGNSFENDGMEGRWISRGKCVLVGWLADRTPALWSQLLLCCIAVDRIAVLKRPIVAANRDAADHRRLLQRSLMVVAAVELWMSLAMACGVVGRLMQTDNTSASDLITYQSCTPASFTMQPFIAVELLTWVIVALSIVTLNVVVVYHVRKVIRKRRQLNNVSVAESMEKSVRSCHALLMMTGIFILNPVLPLLAIFALVAGGLPVGSPLVVALGSVVRSANDVNASINIVVYTLKHQGIRAAVFGLFGY